VNPFTVPAGMLFYRLAKSLLQDTTRHRAATITDLLHNAVMILPAHRYPEVVVLGCWWWWCCKHTATPRWWWWWCRGAGVLVLRAHRYPEVVVDGGTGGAGVLVLVVLRAHRYSEVAVVVLGCWWWWCCEHTATPRW
jgi:hypothetical protein